MASTLTTISQKLLWIKSHPDNLALMTKCSDKLRVGEYCKDVIGFNLCNEVYQVCDKPEKIDYSKLPNSFVIKCNHGSSYNIIVKDKNKLNKNEVNKKVERWLATNYAAIHGEKNYENIQRRVFVEKMYNGTPVDYKFWCFNGEPKFMTANLPGSKNINHYDLDFNLLPYSRADHPADKNLKFKKPDNLKLMVDYARLLSKPFLFVRVDFYELDGKVVLGEMTFFPGAGNLKYNGNYGTEIGNMLDLNSRVEMFNLKNYKKCVYTALYGDYDSLPEIKKKNQGYDYICFTDSNIKSDTWKIVNFSKFPCELDNTRKNRYIKLNPHLVIPEYDLSIYIDANFTICGDMDDFLLDYAITPEKILSAGKHPSRRCIYAESKAVISANKDKPDVVKAQMSRYEKEKYPKNNGLTQNCILIRFHNDEWCKKVMEICWNEVLKGSKRDQLSLFYALWRCPEKRINVLPVSIFNSNYLKWGVRHKKMAKSHVSDVKNKTKATKQPLKNKKEINTSLYNFRN